MARQAGYSVMDYCSSDFPHLDRVAKPRPLALRIRLLKMLNRRAGLLLLILVVACSIAAAIWYYQSKCHGMDACAAAGAESHERDRPSEPR
jgi:hypothetical protein